MIMDESKISYLDVVKSLNIARDAIRKQVPMKSITTKTIAGEIIYSCRNCRENIEHWNYCPYCGQRLKFEVINNE